jgi:hypothetical protein
MRWLVAVVLLASCGGGGESQRPESCEEAEATVVSLLEETDGQTHEDPRFPEAAETAADLCT